jgi:hypothetical protein
MTQGGLARPLSERYNWPAELAREAKQRLKAEGNDYR